MQQDKSEPKQTTGILDEFQTELVDCWRRLPNKVFFLTLLAAWLALFQFWGNSTFGYIKTPSLLRWTYDVCSGWAPTPDQEDRQGLIMPFIVLGLFWWKRKELLSLRLQTWWPGLLLVGLGVVLHLVGYLIQEPRVSILALFTGIYGLMGLAWGREWLRASFFPFFLFIFCIPFGTLVEPVTFPLRLWVSGIVEFIAHYVLGIDVVRVGTQLFNPSGRYQYDVAAACSGIRSLFAIGLMSTVGAFLYFKGWGRRILLIAAAVPLAVIANVIRLLTIIISAELGGQKAGDYVHEGGPLGIISLLPYALAFVGLIAIGKLLREEGDSKSNPL